MLAIQRKLPVPKLVTAGVLAFTVGLTASAAYLSTTIERMPYSFSTLQPSGEDTSSDKPADKVTKDATDAGSSASPPSLSVGTASTPNLMTEWTPATTSPSGSPASVGTGGSALPGTSTPTPGSSTEQAPAVSGSSTVTDAILQPVSDVIDGTVQTIIP